MGGLLLGGVAFAQQGLIADPWAPRAGSALVLVPPALTEAAVEVPTTALVRATHEASTLQPAVVPPKWSPPVVELLVDPWASTQGKGALVPPRPSWAPKVADVVDPWALAAPAEAPRVASRSTGPRYTTIF